MSDSWLISLETLIERWRGDASPVQLTPAAAFEIPAASESPTASAAPAQVDLRPALTELSREGRVAFLELADAIRTSLSELAGAVKSSVSDVPPAALASSAEFAVCTEEIAAQMLSLRTEVKAVLFQLGTLANSKHEEAPAAPVVDTQALVEALKPHMIRSEEPAPATTVAPEVDTGSVVEALRPLVEGLGAESRAGRSELMDAVRNALAEFSEEDMVGRAGLAKSLKIGMADLAEKNRRSLAELKEGLAGGGAGAGDTVTFHPEAIPEQVFATSGEVGAFPQSLSENGPRRISLADCYAAQVNDDSMVPVASDGQTLLASRNLPVRNGDMVIAQLAEGTWVFKRYVLREGQHQLQSVNPQLGLPTIILAEAPQQIHVVVAVVFGRALARVPQEAGASSAAAGAAGQ